MNKLAYKRMLLATLSLLLAGTISFYEGSLFLIKPDVEELIITLYSILAGFLIAVMTIDIGFNDLSHRFNKRGKSLVAKEIKRKLTRQKFLFYLYLLSIIIVLAKNIVDPKYIIVVCALKKMFLFVSSFSLLMSLNLPNELMNAQQERIDDVISK